MPTVNLLKQQQEIIQRSYSIISDYNRQRSNAEDRFKQERESADSAWNRDKGTIEAKWRQEKETIERNWNETKTKADSILQSVDETSRSTLIALEKSQWRDKLPGGSSLIRPLPNNDELKQMEINQSATESTSKEISSLLNGFRWSGWPGILAIVSGFTITLMLFIILGVNLNGYLSNAATGWVYALSCIIAGVSFALLLYSIVWTFRSKVALPRLKNAYTTLLQARASVVDLHKRIVDPQRIYQPQLNEAQLRYNSSINQLNQTHERLVDECQTLYAETKRRLNQQFANDLSSLQLADSNLRREAQVVGWDWNELSWEQWQPSQTINSVVRIGTLTTGLHKDLPSIPGFIACPSGENILFKASGKGKDIATTTIQSLMLQLLTTQPPGKVRFTLIDPIGLGQSVANFMQLADYDERLVNSRVWTESRHIEQQLAALSEHMEDVIQKYLRGQYTTIEEYNEQAGEVAEPYRVLVVIGFPVNFSEDAARRLVKIASNGPRCGVSTIVMVDTEQPVPYGFNQDDLERVSTILEWDGQRTIWRDKDFEKCQLQLDKPPELKLFNALLEKIGQDAKNANQVQVPFDRVTPSRENWWKGSTRDGLNIALGRVGAKKLQYLDLGKGTSQHALVVGKTGSGKTTLLHVLIANLSLTYSPDELELYLVDFKTVGFTPYATYMLPHARVIAIQSEREFGLSVLQGLDSELERRKNIFSKAGVQDIRQYRDAQLGAHMPRILLLVDEFQEFFTYDDKISQEAGLLLDRLVRQGRAFGMHIMLGSQTLSGSYSLARATIGQMAVRIALQCEESDSRLVLSDDNPAARLLSRPGEAIYNAANGLIEGNNPFQCSLLSDNELDSYLGAIHSFAEEKRHTPLWNQIIFDGSKDAHIADNRVLESVIKAPSWVIPQKYAQAWIGEPIAIKDPTTVQIRHQAGYNLLVLGQQEETALGIMVASLLSLAAQHAPGTVQFYLVDFSPSDAANADLLRSAAEALPHQMKVVNRRGLLQVVSSIADEVQDRIEADGGIRQPIYFFIYGLQRARDLRPEEDFSFSTFGSDAPAAPNPAKQFSLILREGPELGVHTLAWCDTLANLNRNLERGLLREFELRIAFQMSQEDSMNFVDSTAANNLGPHRALFFSEETGRAEKFLPYGIPDTEWLQQATEDITRKQ